MEAKTGKELLEVIHDDNMRHKINKFKGSNAKAVFANNAVYIIGSDSGTDFDNGSDFLKWRLKILGFDSFIKEIDTTDFDFANEVLDAMSENWTEQYIEMILVACYHMEDLDYE